MRLFTKSVYDFRGFDEVIVKQGRVAYREVEPKRSKLFAGIAKGLSQIGIREGSSVLYLGASHGYTASFVSDVVGRQGRVWCVDVAPRVVRDLVLVCEQRANMLPLLADCRQPSSYKEFLPSPVDVVFQDIAQRDQVSIFLKNCDAYLKKGGFGLLSLKARSIDVARKPAHVFKESYEQLVAAEGYVVVDKKDLEPFEKDHMLFVVKRR